MSDLLNNPTEIYGRGIESTMEEVVAAIAIEKTTKNRPEVIAKLLFVEKVHGLKGIPIRPPKKTMVA